MTAFRNVQRGRLLCRQLRLIELLQSDGWQSLHSLATKTGVGTRTVRRDVAALEDAHFAVVTARHDDGVRRWKLRRGASCPLCSRRLSAAPASPPAAAAVGEATE